MSRRREAFFFLVLLGALGALAVPPLAGQPAPPPPTVEETGELPPLREPPPFSDPVDRSRDAPPAPDPGSRTHEVLKHSCLNPLGHREVTLFANGTVRLRDGLPGKEWMGLAELGPEELSGALGRLAAEDLGDANALPSGVDGTWVERCELTLELAGRPKKVYRYGRYDTLPLSLSKIVRVAVDLSTEILALKDKEELPQGYVPEIGDVLKRVDGRHFEIFSFTGEGKGLEMRSMDDPLGLYILKDQLRMEFVAVVSRRPK